MAAKLEIVSVALNEGEAETSIKKILETDVQSISSRTTGKVFIGIKVESEGPAMFGLNFDGQNVEISQNEKTLRTNVRPKPGKNVYALPIDLPMRIVGNPEQIFPCEHRFSVFWADEATSQHGWNGFCEFVLRLTGLTPVVKYDPKRDSD